MLSLKLKKLLFCLSNNSQLLCDYYLQIVKQINNHAIICFFLIIMTAIHNNIIFHNIITNIFTILYLLLIKKSQIFC